MSFKGLYPKIDHGRTAHMKNARSPGRKNNNAFIPNEKINAKTTSLDDLASAVMKKYKDNPEICDEVVGRINLYRINLTIAKEYKNKESQKELTKGIRNYLYELLKKEN